MTDPVRPVAPREALIAMARKMTGDMHTWGVDESRVDYTMPPTGKYWLIKHLADALAAAPVPCAAEETTVLQAVLDAIKGTLDPYSQIADHPNVKFAQMQRLQWMKAAEWQPIETAPKDGTRVLIAEPHPSAEAVESWFVVEGRYLTEMRTVEGWHSAHVGIMLCGGEEGEWREAQSRHYVAMRPTHWMPLPSPPRATGEGARDDHQATPIQPAGVPRVLQGVHADDGPAALREASVQGATDALSESSGAGRDADAPVAVARDPHRLLDLNGARQIGVPNLWRLVERLTIRVGCETELNREADLSKRELNMLLARLRGAAAVRE